MSKKTFLIMIITLVIISVLMLGSRISAQNKAKKYQQDLNRNNVKIIQIDEIQSNLHTLAESVRAEQDNNNGFDSILSEKWHEYQDIKQSLEEDNLELSKKIEDGDKFEYVGDFTITYYCPCSTCNGSYTTTAIGTQLQPYKTIAVDPKVIPLGSIVQIHDLTFIAEDTGGAIKGNRIDICAATHKEALSLGVLKNVPVFVMKP